MFDYASSPMPLDQADGLRRMFPGARVRFVPVVSNPHLAFGGLMLERLCTAFSDQDAQVLLVDASERAQAADEMALVELAACIQTLSPRVSYLAARGLPVRFVDTHGFTSEFLDALVDACMRVDVVLVHAPAGDLCRLFSRRDSRHTGRGDMRPLLLCDDRPTSVTHAYAAMKLLTQRGGQLVHDLLLGAAPHSPRADRIAAQLRECADSFLGAVLRDAIRIDPAVAADEPVTTELSRWAAEWLADGSGAGRSALEQALERGATLLQN